MVYSSSINLLISSASQRKQYIWSIFWGVKVVSSSMKLFSVSLWTLMYLLMMDSLEGWYIGHCRTKCTIVSGALRLHMSQISFCFHLYTKLFALILTVRLPKSLNWLTSFTLLKFIFCLIYDEVPSSVIINWYLDFIHSCLVT